MKARLIAQAALAVLLALAPPVAAVANPLVGSWSAPGGQTMTVKADGTMTWGGAPLRYQVQGNVLVYQNAQGGGGMAEFMVQGDQVVMAGAEIGMVQLSRVPAGATPRATPAPPAGPAPSQAPAPPPPARSAAPAAPAEAGDYVAKAYGFRMTPAPGWGHKETPEAVLFGHSSTPGLVMVTLSDENVTEAEVEKAAREGYSEPGVSLEPVTPGKFARVPTGAGTGYYFRVTGTLQGKAMAGFTGVYLPPGGQAVIVLAVTTPEQLAELEPDARAMLSSVRLHKAESPAIRTWDKELRGFKVQYMWSYYSGGGADGSYVGGSNNKDWHLCADGRYWYQGRSNVSADAGGGGPAVSALGQGGANEVGTWEVVANGHEGAAIVFHPRGADSYRYVLSKQRKRGTSFMQKHFGDLGVYAAEAAQCN